MKSINFALIGNPELGKEFGKKGTESDITIYDRKENNVIRTWNVPTGFPDKIQPLLQVINMSEYSIVDIEKLDKFTGEIIIALDILGVEKGIISHSYEVDRNTLLNMIKGTSVENFKLVERDDLKSEVNQIEPVKDNGEPKVVVDHCFNVKGVGTVILARVAKGGIKTYDKLKILPQNKEVLIKSIQMHDDPVNEAKSPSRVGLSVKGVNPDEVGRGDIISSDENLKTPNEFTIEFRKNKFFKDEINEGQSVLVSIGLQIKSAKISSTEPMTLQFIKPGVIEKNQIAVLLKPESSTLRIIGGGRIL